MKTRPMYSAFRFSKWLIVVMACASFATTATGATISLNGAGTTSLSSGAQEGSTSITSDEDTVAPTALPYTHTSTTAYGAATSQAGYSLSDTGFDITFDHARTGTNGSIAYSGGSIYFSFDEDVTYQAAGAYSASDPDARQVYLRGLLYDETAASIVFDSSQHSLATANESFTLGLSEGDYSNSSVGSLNGTLIAGHDYRMFYSANLRTWPGTSSVGATSSGSLSLVFTPVPEPSTAFLVMMGLLGISAQHKRLRSGGVLRAG